MNRFRVGLCVSVALLASSLAGHAAALSAAKEEVAQKSDKELLAEAWKVFWRSPKARKLYREALKRRKVKTLKLRALDPTENMPYGCFEAKRTTIFVNPKLSLAGRVAVLLGEVYRAWDVDDDSEEKAAEGKLSRKAYVVASEKRGFKLVKKHHEIAKKAVEEGHWPSSTDWYDGPLKHWTSFSMYLAAMNMAMQEDGPSHADYFRKRWDTFYKKEFLARKLRS